MCNHTNHFEVSPLTQSFDIITVIHQCKWKWLDHILRLPETRLIRVAVKVQYDKGDRLNMLQDIPDVNSFEQLVYLTQDKTSLPNSHPHSTTLQL